VTKRSSRSWQSPPKDKGHHSTPFVAEI